jgi:hypothetical protein
MRRTAADGGSEDNDLIMNRNAAPGNKRSIARVVAQVPPSTIGLNRDLPPMRVSVSGHGLKHTALSNTAARTISGRFAAVVIPVGPPPDMPTAQTFPNPRPRQRSATRSEDATGSGPAAKAVHP